MGSTNKETMTFSRLSPRRHWTNLFTRYTVGVGGGAVIGAITLIFAYLLWVVAPILLPAEIEDPAEYNLGDRPTTLIDVSENGEVIFRASADGFIEFFSIEDGRVLRAYNLNKSIKSARRVSPLVDTYALLDNNNNLLFVRAEYIVNFVNGERQLSPKLSFPFSNRSIPLGEVAYLDTQLVDDELVIAAVNNNELTLTKYKNTETGFPLSKPSKISVLSSVVAEHVFLGPRNLWI